MLRKARLSLLMKIRTNLIWYLAGLSTLVCAPAHATVSIISVQPTVSSPQVLGTTINWVVKATDSNTGPLTFQFNVAPPGATPVFALARDFNVGTLSSGVWTSPPFAWTPTGFEGKYQIQVVIKDFTTAPPQTASLNATFQVTPLATGSAPLATPTANPLVALFSAPSCAKGSAMRVIFQEQSLSKPATTTNTASCHPPTTMNFEIAGMYPSTAYNMYSQTITGGVPVNGPTVNFTTGALPANIPFPPYKTVLKPQVQADSAASVLLLSPIQFGTNTVYPAVATNLAGQIIWYYYLNSPGHFALLTRPLAGGTFLTLPDSSAWNPASSTGQFLSEIDLAGNVIRQTNTGIVQQELLAMGATDAAPCSSIPSPAPVGAACLGYFHHDAIQTLPNGQIALIADIEKIFPAGTQGDTSSLPVDIVGDMIIVLNSNWQVVWYFDTFQNDSGNGELDINRPAVLGETCSTDETECETMFLLGPGIAPLALDWLHANSLYYDPQDGSIVWSSRHQDWLIKINYNNGAGAGNILWLMGSDGDFTFNNTYNDPWPWFSHQHDAGIQGNGLGSLTLFDNGNTRVTDLGASCGPSDCDSRGMALTVSVTAGQPCAPALTPCGQVSPVLSVDLGAFSEALGSADLLSNANYFFLAPFVPYSPTVQGSASIEILPTAGTDTGTQVFNLKGPLSYRGWRMPSLYQPPII
jgi:hypothetical protein